MFEGTTSNVISPAVLAAVQPDPSHSPDTDQLSARRLLTVAARLVREVAESASTTTTRPYGDASTGVIVAVHPSTRPHTIPAAPADQNTMED